MKVKFDVHGKWVEGELVKWGNKTCVVKYKEPEDKGGLVKIFKRHIMKHHVVEVAETATVVEPAAKAECSSDCASFAECKAEVK
jgi:hypothetical protein